MELNVSQKSEASQEKKITDLDSVYTALCQAIDRAGPERRELFLAMLSLKLLSEHSDGDAAITTLRSVLAQALQAQGSETIK